MKEIILDYEKIYNEEYIKNKKSCKEIASIYGLGKNTIYRNFNKKGLELGINRIDYSDVLVEKFKEFSPDMFYWLGFIAADGSVHKRTKGLTIMLQCNDRDHLYKLSKWIRLPDRCITDVYVHYKGEKQKAIRLYFSIKEISDILIKYDIIPNKSNKEINFLEKVPEEYKINFIMGYFDGDGSVYIHNNKQSGGISFVGNYYLLNSIRNYLVKNYNFNEVKTYDFGNSLFGLTWTSIKDMYQFSILYKKYNKNGLDRKKEKLEEIEISDYYRRALKYKFNCDFCNKKIFNKDDMCDKCKTGMKILKNNKKLKECIKCKKKLSYRTKGAYCSKCIIEFKRKVERPNKIKLEELIKTVSFEEIGRMYDVSGNAVKKWCKYYNLPNTVKEINKVYKINKKTGCYVRPDIKKVKEKSMKTISGYKNVYINKNKNKPYQSRVCVKGEIYNLGNFLTADEAAKKSDEKLIELLGDEAITNKKLGLI
jgi:transposase